MNNARSLATSVFIIVSAATAIAIGQTRPDGKPSPEMVAEKALRALKEDRISDFAGTMHPDALAQLKAMLLSVAGAADQQGQADEILALFDGIRTLDELRKLDDAAFFISFFKAMMEQRPEIKNALRGMSLKVIGHVAEGDGVVHVVYRGTVSTEGLTITKMAVMSLKSTESGWGMLLTGDIENMANMLKRRFENEE